MFKKLIFCMAFLSGVAQAYASTSAFADDICNIMFFEGPFTPPEFHEYLKEKNITVDKNDIKVLFEKLETNMCSCQDPGAAAFLLSYVISADEVERYGKLLSIMMSQTTAANCSPMTQPIGIYSWITQGIGQIAKCLDAPALLTPLFDQQTMKNHSQEYKIELSMVEYFAMAAGAMSGTDEAFNFFEVEQFNPLSPPDDFKEFHKMFFERWIFYRTQKPSKACY